MRFTKPDIKQAITDADAWAALVSTRQSYNTALTASDFKTNASDAEKILILVYALLASIEG